MEKKLSGKVALVTGASQGIGKGIAQVFAEEGADVIVNDKNLSAQSAELVDWIRGHGGKAIDLAADVSNRKQVEAMFDRAWNEFGSIDILVNNAGIETIVPFLEITDCQWNEMLNVNLRGQWLCSQVFCRLVTAAKRPASIINIGSIQAAKTLPGRTHYAPTKLAIEALTRNMSAEMTPLGIRVNCIHPGLIETSMIDWVLKDPELLSQVVAQISLGRPGTPREIGTVAAFFASEDARYVTGQSLLVDGGWAGK